MAFSYSPKIITEGLVLYLDAANPYSYVSGSTSWNDISRGGNNGTLVNGPTFSSANNGSIVFDGTNDYVNCGNSTALNSSNITFSTWIRRTASWNFPGSCIFWAKPNGDFTGNGFYIEPYTPGRDVLTVITNGAAGSYFLDTISSNSRFALNTWINFAFTLNGNTPNMYFNGVLSSTTVGGVPAITSTSDTKYILSNSPIYGNYTPGNIAITQIYNRALSAQEVLQNYNATKTRFGLT
jgi:hypothetical protein